MRAGEHPRPLIVLVAAAALAFAAHAIEFSLRHPLADTLVSDARLYHEWARSIAAGDWLGPPEPYHHPPLYPYLLGVLYLAVGPHPTAARLLQALFAALFVGLVALAARRVAPRREALLAAAAAALCSGLAFYVPRLLPCVLASFLAALGLERLLAARWRPAPLFGCGVLFGLLAAARPNQLLAAVAVFTTLFVLARGRRLAISCSFAAGVALAIAPFFARNLVRSGEPVLLCDTGGINLWFAHNPRAGVTFRAPDSRFGDVERQSAVARALAEAAEGRSLGFGEVQSHFARRALSYAARHPRTEARLAWQRTRAFLSPEELGIVSSPPAEAGFLATERLFFVPSALFAVLGCAAFAVASRRRRRGRRVALLTAFLAAQWATVVLFFPYERFRVVALAAAVPLAAVAVSALAGRRTARGPRRILVGLLAVLGGFVGWTAPRYGAEQEAAGHVTVALALFADGQTEAALERLDRAEAAAPRQARTLWARARILRATGRPDEARSLLESAVAQGATAPPILGELALTYVRLGSEHRDRAIALARRALEADPLEPSAREAWATALMLGGDPARAAEILAPVERFPDPPPRLLALLADAYLRSGRVEDAARVKARLERP